MMITSRKKVTLFARQRLGWLFGLLSWVLVACQTVSVLPLETASPTWTVAPTLTNTSTWTPSPASSPTLTPSETPSPTASSTLTVTPEQSQSSGGTPIEEERSLVRFAVIGDYGIAGPAEAVVASLVQSWGVDFIVTTGDNNYPRGAAETIDRNIGQYYHAFIYPYNGEYGPGAEENRFFPVLGNHDWDTSDAQPYLDYFDLPGNERYYDVVWGPVHIFALDSDPNEPDGVGVSSIQAQWLKEALAASTRPWKIVVMHHPPYSSASHGDTEWMQWPFPAWGASVVFSGHDHVYERIMQDGFPYIVNGLGGSPHRYFFSEIHSDSVVRYRNLQGAMLVEATENRIVFQFVTIRGEVIDRFVLPPE